MYTYIYIYVIYVICTYIFIYVKQKNDTMNSHIAITQVQKQNISNCIEPFNRRASLAVFPLILFHYSPVMSESGSAELHVYVFALTVSNIQITIPLFPTSRTLFTTAICPPCHLLQEAFPYLSFGTSFSMSPVSHPAFYQAPYPVT